MTPRRAKPVTPPRQVGPLWLAVCCEELGHAGLGQLTYKGTGWQLGEGPWPLTLEFLRHAILFPEHLADRWAPPAQDGGPHDSHELFPRCLPCKVLAKRKPEP